MVLYYRTFHLANPEYSSKYSLVWNKLFCFHLYLLLTTFDNENRKVTILEGNDWQFQMDDDLPVILKVGDEIKIPKGIYHRIKRGSNDLKIKIEFYN